MACLTSIPMASALAAALLCDPSGPSNALALSFKVLAVLAVIEALEGCVPARKSSFFFGVCFFWSCAGSYVYAYLACLFLDRLFADLVFLPVVFSLLGRLLDIDQPPRSKESTEKLRQQILWR